MASFALEWTWKFAFPVSILCLKWVRWLSLHVRVFPSWVYVWSPDSCWQNAYLLQAASEQQWGTQEIRVVMDALKWMKWFLGGRRIGVKISASIFFRFNLNCCFFISMYDLRYLFKAKLIFSSPSPPPQSMVRIWYVNSKLIYQPAWESTHWVKGGSFLSLSPASHTAGAVLTTMAD